MYMEKLFSGDFVKLKRKYVFDRHCWNSAKVKEQIYDNSKSSTFKDYYLNVGSDINSQGYFDQSEFIDRCQLDENTINYIQENRSLRRNSV